MPTVEYNEYLEIARNATDREDKGIAMGNAIEKKRELDRVISDIESIERTLRYFDEYRNQNRGN